ncbi:MULTISPECIES: iron-sulfur cluster assembly protein [unclassified Saccharopolyspora]|uniref:iron-sulfur cluster assembly protein n=1 Tax=unclassified Saccharopolyspora TaxID=2646250 RepID=UPI001CD28F30|nr:MULTISPECIES: iron-sulfur cluster assembly protein [unclassified Saccharopolyspora]MCA1189893.1 iron-sulfur cluster assembly protein [Saccharopolyspora sp. 6T]MCA1191183.1 iron-sulfur cluster assembly protein [Saccharopolyspora sp. 6V]MCA1229281.1 iron-sulfur cluster assembly protein [Saccharopolyspora sp. 6M]MCA1282874.1 iron-sulfur cluster assembly protein [Saccharopolyspora sp. 7B]
MTTAVNLETEVWRALDAVLDPELDQPVTDLEFVSRVAVDRSDVQVDLRLPTYFCAPNFAYLMVADAHDAVAELPWVRRVRVRLLDHFASEEINAGVAAGDGFDAAFPGLAAGELEELRTTFLRKAHLAYQEQVAQQLLRSGTGLEQLVQVRLGNLPPSQALDRLRRRRDQLGLPSGPDAPLLVDDAGAPVPVEGLSARLRFARTTRVSIEGNAGWCRGLLDTRYGPGGGTARPGLH